MLPVTNYDVYGTAIYWKRVQILLK